MSASLQAMLENHAQAGLPAADLQVIRRGKALEYFSRHYGKVYVDEGRTISVKDALVGINQLIDEDANKGERTAAGQRGADHRASSCAFSMARLSLRATRCRSSCGLWHRAGRVRSSAAGATEKNKVFIWPIRLTSRATGRAGTSGG